MILAAALPIHSGGSERRDLRRIAAEIHIEAHQPRLREAAVLPPRFALHLVDAGGQFGQFDRLFEQFDRTAFVDLEHPFGAPDGGLLVTGRNLDPAADFPLFAGQVVRKDFRAVRIQPGAQPVAHEPVVFRIQPVDGHELRRLEPEFAAPGADVLHIVPGLVGLRAGSGLNTQPDQLERPRPQPFFHDRRDAGQHLLADAFGHILRREEVGFVLIEAPDRKLVHRVVVNRVKRRARRVAAEQMLFAGGVADDETQLEIPFQPREPEGDPMHVPRQFQRLREFQGEGFPFGIPVDDPAELPVGLRDARELRILPGERSAARCRRDEQHRG